MAKSKDNQRGHKGQHWVAASYLRAWCRRAVATHEPFLWRYDRDGANPKPKAPTNVFKASDLYTLKKRDGTRDLGLERILGTLESDFNIVRRDKVLPGAELTGKDKAAIMAFMAAQIVRTPSFRDHWAEQMSEVLELGEALEEDMRTASDERRRMASAVVQGGGGPSMTMEQARAVRDHPLLLVSPMMMVNLLTIFSRMHLVIICTDDDLGFIASDAPGVTFDPKWHTYPPMYRQPGLAMPSIEVSMPLAPSRLALLTHNREITGYLLADHFGSALLDDYNRRTRFYAHKHFVVNQKATKPLWFEAGEMPPDAWERTIAHSPTDDEVEVIEDATPPS